MRKLTTAVVFLGLHTITYAKQPLCSIDQITAVEQGIEVAFKGKVTLNGTVIDNESGPSTFTFKSDVTTHKDKGVKSIFVRENSAAYVANGFTESCVIRSVIDEGKKGAMVEKYIHIPRQPPQSTKEFVEAQ